MEFTEIEEQLKQLSAQELVNVVSHANDVCSEVDHFHCSPMDEFNDVFNDSPAISVAIAVHDAANFNPNDDFFTVNPELSSCSFDAYVAEIKKHLDELAEVIVDYELGDVAVLKQP